VLFQYMNQIVVGPGVGKVFRIRFFEGVVASFVGGGVARDIGEEIWRLLTLILDSRED
jgi:hypothetical protein